LGVVNYYVEWSSRPVEEIFAGEESSGAGNSNR
jgi:hypothetical protein